MKYIFLIATCISINLSSALAQTRMTANEKVTAHLKKFSADYIKSRQDKNPEMLKDYYADNIRLMPEFQKTVMGKSNALSYYQAFADRFTIQACAREKIEILDMGKKVIELGLFTMSVKLKSTGKEYILKGKYQDFWEIGEDGKILLITEAWNYSHDVEIADQLRFQEVPAVNISLEAHVPVNSNISFELAALNKLLETTISEHDAKLWGRFYSDDIKYIYSAHPIVEGRKAMDEFLEKHVSGLPVFEKLDIRTDRIDTLSNYVIEYASHIAIIRNGEFSGVFTGKDIRIWRRERDGSLKTFREMAMYD